jgi:hypothetical protein
LSEAFAVPQSDCCPIAKRIQKIVFSFVVLVSDPKAFDLVDQVIARFYEWALAIREKALGAEHPDTGTSLNNLANLLASQGDYVVQSRYTSGHGRSTRRRWEPSIPIRARASTTSRACLNLRATTWVQSRYLATQLSFRRFGL